MFAAKTYQGKYLPGTDTNCLLNNSEMKRDCAPSWQIFLQTYGEHGVRKITWWTQNHNYEASENGLSDVVVIWHKCIYWQRIY